MVLELVLLDAGHLSPHNQTHVSLEFDCLPIPRETLDDLNIPQGIQVMAKTHTLCLIDKEANSEILSFLVLKSLFMILILNN